MKNIMFGDCGGGCCAWIGSAPSARTATDAQRNTLFFIIVASHVSQCAIFRRTVPSEASTKFAGSRAPDGLGKATGPPHRWAEGAVKRANRRRHFADCSIADSEQFRSVPRTGRPACETFRTAVD